MGPNQISLLGLALLVLLQIGAKEITARRAKGLASNSESFILSYLRNIVKFTFLDVQLGLSPSTTLQT